MIRETPVPAVLPRLLATLLLFATALCAQGVRAEVRAWLDRSAVSMGETVTLNVESGSTGEPDFSVLEKDFRITSRSSNTQIQLINGAMARTNLWAVALEPLREGVIDLPAIPVGGERTAPLQLTVRPMARGSAADGDDVFLEVEVDTPAPYVQQQVGYTVRLFYAVALQSGDLSDPSGDGLQVQRIGQDAQYTRGVQGRAYNVVERRYALTPERSGTLSVAGITFRGRLARGGQAGGFFSQGTPVSVGSETIALDVRPAPSAAPSPWLPASALRFSDTASRLPREARVGDALELTLTLEAEGLSSEQLPELTLPAIVGAEVYPDQETRETREVDGKRVGVRSRKFAIVPLRAGRLELPERSIAWWNVGDDRAQRNILPARSVEVLPAPVASPQRPSAPEAAAGVPHAASNPLRPDLMRLWQVLAVFFALAWALTLLLWWLQARRERGLSASAAPSRASASWRPELAHALARDDLAGARRALLRIAPGTRDLESLAARLADGEQREAVLALDRALYRGDGKDGMVGRLRAAFARSPELRAAANAMATDEGALPPLYPPR